MDRPMLDEALDLILRFEDNRFLEAPFLEEEI